MDFYLPNKFNTTTMITIDSGGGSAVSRTRLFDGRDVLTYPILNFQITFPSVTAISHVILLNHNIRNLTIGKDGVATWVYSAVDTGTTDNIFYFPTATFQSLEITCGINQAGGTIASLGELILTEKVISFEAEPDIANYNPIFYRKANVHVMANGGIKTYVRKDKFQAKIHFDYMTPAHRLAMYELWKTGSPYWFIHSPALPNNVINSGESWITANTSADMPWDGEAYEVAWVGDFNFNFSSNIYGNGFSGDIVLKETGNG